MDYLWIGGEKMHMTDSEEGHSTLQTTNWQMNTAHRTLHTTHYRLNTAYQSTEVKMGTLYSKILRKAKKKSKEWFY